MVADHYSDLLICFYLEFSSLIHVLVGIFSDLHNNECILTGYLVAVV